MRTVLSLALFIAGFFPAAAQKTITVRASQPGIAISPTLYGIFFEDINWAADGGLYAEMVQNRSFEYINAFGSQYTATTGWTLVRRGGAAATMSVLTNNPLNDANPHYVEIKIEKSGTQAGIANSGFGGIAVMRGETYTVSLWMRRTAGAPAPITVSLEKPDSTVLGKATFDSASSAWTLYKTSISVDASETAARLVVGTAGSMTLCLDMVSLFPQKTFNNRSNGLRADLVQRLVDMKPKFIRFPGGCIVHSNDLATAYRWKTTIGSVEQRRYTPNRWGYMQSGGLGFFEFFQLCEDIGAIPIPIVPCGVSCHFKSPYQIVALSDLQPWIDDALELIEYANGSSTSTWGALRAAAGHPEPFNLEYIGVGNEEWGPEFKERSALFVKAIRTKYPAINIVGTAGPSASGTDFTDLWAFNRTQKTEIVDEHYYQPTSWFLANTRRYDSYDRKDPLVFAGEYASRTPAQKTLANAVAEAAFMTGLERNSDLVRLSCYAPLFCNVNCNGAPAEGPWNPDLIYFDQYRSYGTPSYHVQALFANNIGHRILPTAISTGSDGPLYAVTSLDTLTGEILLKVVNSGTGAESCTLHVEGAVSLQSTGTVTTLTSGKPDDANSFAQPEKVVPQKRELTGVKPAFAYTFAGNSVTVLRLATRTTRVGDRPGKGARTGTHDVSIVRHPRGITLQLTLRQGSRCTVRCMTSGGRVVANINDSFFAAGDRKLHLSSATLPPGVYVIEVSLGLSNRSVHRVTLVH